MFFSYNLLHVFIQFCDVGGLTVILDPPTKIADYLDCESSTHFLLNSVIAQIGPYKFWEETKCLLMWMKPASRQSSGRLMWDLLNGHVTCWMDSGDRLATPSKLQEAQLFIMSATRTRRPLWMNDALTMDEYECCPLPKYLPTSSSERSIAFSILP